MKRLTIENCGSILVRELSGSYTSPCFGCESLGNCVSKKIQPCAVYRALEKLKNYEDLDEQGELLKLHCKVGDEVWYICERVEKQGRKKIEVSFVDNGTVDNITLGHAMIPQITVCNDENIWITFDEAEDFGKTVFLTQEEAEVALQKMNETEGTE